MKCVMRTCGGGSGAACYSKVFSTAGENTINGAQTYAEIERGCSAIANTDPNCLYAYQDVAGGEYSYMYATEDAFTTLFPKKASGSSDPIGLVAALNSSLSLNYNDAAIANMKKQCQNVATSCVRSLCGADYVNCYRNRTDVMSTLTKTTGEGSDAFNKSMNKVGGVLDYTIVLGLCSETVKNASSCEEHLAIEKAKVKSADSEYVQAWGGQDTVRGGWYDAGGAVGIAGQDAIHKKDENGNTICKNNVGVEGICNTVDAGGAIYDKPVVIGYETYVQTQATESLFQDLLYDLEKEAQAKYNAKLTKEQNDCLAANNGGIMGQNELGSTYMWAKLKNNKVPADYSSQGLKANQFVASNELYGSFCRAKVTIHSDDINILNALNGTLVTKGADGNFASKSIINKDWATRYFAIGDTFVCGSWIPQQALMEIANAVGENARADKEASQPKIKGWMTALGAVGLGTGGAFLGDAIQDGNAFSGLLDKPKAKKSSDAEKLRKNCQTYFDSARSSVLSVIPEDKFASESGDAVDASARKGYNLLVDNGVSLMNGSDNVWTTYTTKLAEYNGLTSSTAASNNTPTNEKGTDLKNAIDALYAKCAEIKTDSEKENNWFKQHGGTVIGAGVGAIGGGLLGYYITDAVQKAELDKAQQAAIEEFMTNIGSKIQCYIGSELVGTYGQPVPTSME